MTMGNNFLPMTPKAQETKAKTHYIKFQNFCASKDTIKSKKATYKTGENICTSPFETTRTDIMSIILSEISQNKY